MFHSRIFFFFSRAYPLSIDPLEQEFARAMNHLGDGHNKADRMGYLAQARIMNVFSRKSFGEELHSHLTYLSSTACFPAVFCYPGRFFLVCILLCFITWVIQRSTFCKLVSPLCGCGRKNRPQKNGDARCLRGAACRVNNVFRASFSRTCRCRR